MARSKDVYAVIGKMCVNVSFRNQFFESPEATATSLVGSLTADEIDQVKRMAGLSEANRETYVESLKQACGNVYSVMRCPNFPCPDDDSPVAM